MVGVWVVGCGVDTKKPDRLAWLLRAFVVCCFAALCRRFGRDIRRWFFCHSEGGGLLPACGAVKRLVQKIVREFGHGDFFMLGFMVEDRDEEP